MPVIGPVKSVLVRRLHYDVIVFDEVGYVPLAEIGAEFLFQVIAERVRGNFCHAVSWVFAFRQDVTGLRHRHSRWDPTQRAPSEPLPIAGRWSCRGTPRQ